MLPLSDSVLFVSFILFLLSLFFFQTKSVRGGGICVRVRCLSVRILLAMCVGVGGCGLVVLGYGYNTDTDACAFLSFLFLSFLSFFLLPATSGGNVLQL